MKKKLSIIIALLTITVIAITLIPNKKINIVNYIRYKEEAEQEQDYQMEQIKLFAITLETKNEYIENVRKEPTTCKININRVTKIIYMDETTKIGEKSAIYGEPIGDMLQPTKLGHIFEMWTTKDGEIVTESTTNNATKDLILYAKWRKIVSSLSVNPNGGTWNDSTGTQDFELEYSDILDIPNPTRTGYTFKEWQVVGSESTIEDGKYTMGVENTVLTAVWEANEHTLTINPNTGTWRGTNTNTELAIRYDSTTQIEDPVKTGYTFTGWTVSNGVLDGQNFTLNYDGDVTLTANWIINRYKYIVYHKKQSIDGLSYNSVVEDTVTGLENFGVTLFPPVKTYSGFISPSASSLTINVDSNPPVRNILNYNYDRQRFTLTVNPNTGLWNGSTSSQNVTLYYEQTYTIEPPTKTGYNFAGWDKTANDSVIEDKIFKMGLSNTNLTARWEAENYLLTFDVNGGNALPTSTKQISFNSPYGTLPIPTNGTARFVGWFTQPFGGTEVTASTVVTTPGSRTVYAHWESEFDYSGQIDSVTLSPGTYKLEVWGAQGGKSDHGTAGGLGGYSYGTLTVTSNTTVYIAVGGVGETAVGAGSTGIALVGGYNGGGNGAYKNSDSAGGGGATHIATRTGLLSDLETNKGSILLVAGGGGGAGCTDTYGGYGGGTQGGNGTGTSFGLGYGASQTAGGTNGGASQNGSFGRGGDTGVAYEWPGSGGGGGYYGGGAGANESGGGGSGGGGSGYYSTSLTSAATVAGNQAFTQPSGGSAVGHTGNGYARITKLS